MRYEFFAPAWLRARLLLYAGTHMLIMPLVIGWLWLAYVPAAMFGRPAAADVAEFAGRLRLRAGPQNPRPASRAGGRRFLFPHAGLGGAVAGVVLVLLAGAVAVQAELLARLRARLGGYWACWPRCCWPPWPRTARRWSGPAKACSAPPRSWCRWRCW